MYVLIFIATITIPGSDPSFNTSENYYRGTDKNTCIKQEVDFNHAHAGSSISAACVYLPNHG